jgi:plasmid maintenance system antidote protein VapI
MTNQEYEAALNRLKLTQVGAARLLHVDARTSRRWIAGDRMVNPHVALVLRLLMAKKITPRDIERHMK